MTSPVTRSASAQRVLDVAVELFAELGYDGTSLQQVADRLGVTKAAVYYHFRSKDDMLAAVVDPAFVELDEVIAAAEAGPTARTRQRLALQGYTDYLLAHRVATAWMSRDAAAMTRPTVAERSQAAAVRLRALLDGGEDDATAQVWTGAIGHAVLGAVIAAPDADESWLRAELEALGAHLLRGADAARRRHLPS